MPCQPLMQRLRSTVRVALAGGLAVTLMAVAGCGSGGSDAPDGSATVTRYDADAKTLNIVAGSEQTKVMALVVKPWCESQGYTCNATFLGSVDQARLLQSGSAPYDAFWFASSVFEQLGDQASTLRDVQPMFITPIVFAGWKSEMERLGFTRKDVDIADIVSAVESKKTTVWATNPTQSNSGATTLFAFLNHFAGNAPTTQLTMQQLESPTVRDGIRKFVQTFAKTPPSTGTMMDDCVAHQAQCRTLFTYEDLVIEKNQELAKQGREPLYAVYPRGSLAISDAPLGYFPHGSNPEKEKTFKALQAYLLSAAGQSKVKALGRRPYASIGLSLPGADPKVFNPDWGIQATVNEPTIVYPKADVIEAALDNYQLAYRQPVDAVYCIDGSGSMADNHGWDGVVRSANLLFDPAQARKYLLQVSSRDRTTAIVFNDGVKGGPWTVDGNAPAALLKLRDEIVDVGPDGGTGVFRCLGAAVQHFDATTSGGRRRLVILMTDGQDQVGRNGEVEALRAQGIPVVAVGFGDDADSATLTSIANATRGAAIESSDIVKALRDATSYK